MDIQNYFNYCDDLVLRWIDNDKSLIQNDPFLSTQKDGAGLLETKYYSSMPEPFLGNPDSCSIVCINLNPGYTAKDVKEGIEGDEEVLSRDFAKSICPYSDYAKPFPHLASSPHHISGAIWWQRRNVYLMSLIETYYNVKGVNMPNISKKFPFSIELCPWHSKRWSECGIKIKDNKEALTAINEHTLEPALHAIEHSLVDFAFAVGLDVMKALLDNGFELAMSWGPSENIEGKHFKYVHHNNVRFDNYPKTLKYRNKGKDNEEVLGLYDAYVFFKLLTKVVNGNLLKVLCVLKQGSNNVPGPEYHDLGIDRDILEYVSRVTL